MTIKIDRNTFVTLLWWVILGLDAICLAVLVTVLPRRLRNKVGLRVATSVLLRAAGVKVHVEEGLENVDKNHPQIFVANHKSWFDSFVLTTVLPVPLTFASKKEMFRVPVYNYIMRRLRFVRVDRTHPMGILKNIDATADVVRSGLSFVVYPEGTTSKTDKLGSFKRGVILLARNACVPIVPVTLVGTQEIKAPDSWRINFGKQIKVIISRPIEASATGKKEQIVMIKKIRQIITGNLERAKMPKKTRLH